MKVKELIEKLQKVDPDREVILQKDSEGNGYSPLFNLDVAAYVPNSTWSGEVLYEELTDGLKRLGYSEEDCVEPGSDYIRAVILWPVN